MLKDLDKCLEFDVALILFFNVYNIFIFGIQCILKILTYNLLFHYQQIKDNA